MATLTQSKVKSTLTRHAKDRRSSGVSQFLVGADNDGQLWYTNSYYAAKVDAKGQGINRPVAVQFLDMFNLTPAAKVYEVNGTVTATGQDGPRIGGLLPAADVLVDVERLELVGHLVLVNLGDHLCRAYGTDAHPLFINDDYASWLEQTAGVVGWKGQLKDGELSSLKPVVGVNEAGEVVALVMTVRGNS